MPTTGDQSAVLGLFGRFCIHMKNLRVEPASKGNDLLFFHKDRSKFVNRAGFVIFQIAALDGVFKT